MPSQPTWRYGRSITLVREDVTGRDDYGNDVRGPVSVEVGGCTWWPRESTEVTENGELVATGLTVLAPPDTTVLPTDRVIVSGRSYEVQGEPMVWDHSPFTASRAGVQIELRKVTG